MTARLMTSSALGLVFLLALGCNPAPVTITTPRSPDGAGYCCPGGTPGCECFSLGGFSASGDCSQPTISRVCDAAPPAITTVTDAHGCTHYDVISAQSCLIPPDAGGDAH